MEGASGSCPFAVPAGTRAAEQHPAGPRQAGSTEPSDEEPPGEGLDHHEVMGDGDQGVLEPEGPFSASPENASPVASTNSSTLPELIRSEREEETSRNAVLSENVTSSTGTGSVIEGTQTVMWSRAEFHETTQSEKLCLEVLPSKAAQQDYHMPDVIAVRVQMDGF